MQPPQGRFTSGGRYAHLRRRVLLAGDHRTASPGCPGQRHTITASLRHIRPGPAHRVLPDPVRRNGALSLRRPFSRHGQGSGEADKPPVRPNRRVFPDRAEERRLRDVRCRPAWRRPSPADQCSGISGGGIHPPSSRSSTPATASATWSCHGCATTCTPIGRPAAEVPQRTTAQGQPVRL